MKALFVCKPLRRFCFLKPTREFQQKVCVLIYIFVCFCRYNKDVYCKCCMVSMLFMKKLKAENAIQISNMQLFAQNLHKALLDDYERRVLLYTPV